MTHLYIEQNTGLTEEVNSSIISKLYELAISGDLDETSDLKGRLHSAAGYKNQIDYLNNNFQDLIISADTKYEFFEDKSVENILATNWGDNTGITAAQIASVQNFNSKFNGNTNIQTFDELSKFTNITEINANNRFNNCTNLRSIDLKNITKISGKDGTQRWNFESCSNLENVGDTSNCTYFGQAAFSNCSKLKQVDLTNATYIGNSAFYRCQALTNIESISNVQTIGTSALRESPNIAQLHTINLPNLTEISNTAFYGCTQIQEVVDLGTITELNSVYSNDGIFGSCSGLLRVTLPETLRHIGYGVFNASNNIKYVKILATSVPVYSSEVYGGEIRAYGVSFGESYRDSNVANSYLGRTYPIYVLDSLLSQYQNADNWRYVGPGRLRPLSQFATDFPNE